MTRTQEVAIYTNPDGSMGYVCLGMTTPEAVTNKLKKEGKKDIIVIETKLLWWG